MRKNWLVKISTVLGAACLAVTSADATPVGMAHRNGWFGESSPPASSQRGLEARDDRPSAEISPLRHPVKYFATAMSEMPVVPKSKSGANRTARPATPTNDSALLSAPTGPPTPELAISLAQLSEHQGNVPQARLHYQRALAQWPGHVDLLRAAARMEDRQGQLPVAESLYRQALAANPQHAGALNDLALCLARQGRLEAAVQLLEQAINVQPNEARYRNNVAIVLVEMRQDQRALAHLAAVHGSAEADYNMGQLLVQRGRCDEAAAYFVAAIQQNPQMQAAHEALARLQGTDAAGAAPVARDVPVMVPTPIMDTEPAAPTMSPAGIPQQAMPVGPQFSYPSTARAPEPGASSYAAPNYYAPRPAFPATVDPRVGSRPGYLPSVPNQPSAMQR